MSILSCLLFVALGLGRRPNFVLLSVPQAYASRRAFGVHRFSMQEEHISDKMWFQAADWEPIDSIIPACVLDMVRTCC